MKNPLSSRAIAALVLVVSLAGPAAAQSVVGKGKTGPAPDPVTLDTTGLFQARFSSVGDDLFIGGQPTEKALRDLKAKGVTFTQEPDPQPWGTYAMIRDSEGNQLILVEPPKG